MLTLRERYTREDPESHQGEEIRLKHKVIFQRVHPHKKEKRSRHKYDIQQEVGCAAASFKEMILKQPRNDPPDANPKRVSTRLTHTETEEKVGETTDERNHRARDESHTPRTKRGTPGLQNVCRKTSTRRMVPPKRDRCSPGTG
jgi:hypothetical protein